MLPLVAAAGSVVIESYHAANAGRTRVPDWGRGKRKRKRHRAALQRKKFAFDGIKKSTRKTLNRVCTVAKETVEISPFESIR